MTNVLEKLPRPFFVLAPMDDVTDTVFRQIIVGTAKPDLFFTEFVNVDGLQSPGRSKLLPKLAFTEKEQPIIAQVWGKNPENYYKTAQDIKQMGFAGIDINMGCPVKAVLKNGCCAALINNRGLTGEILQAVREGVGPDFPVSVKTRLGYGAIDYSWHEYLLQYKLNMLTIHGRTVSQMSKVPADWDAIGHIAELRTSLSPDTFVVGNGDVLTRQQGVELAEKHGLDGIMIGRGVFHDPYVFSSASTWAEMNKVQRVALYTSHVKLFVKTHQNNERKLHTLNKFCKVYIEGFPGAKELREKLMTAQTADELLSILDQSV
ncbi:MAG TPA: tRNA-dihydrouridine synthase [Candidatus Saccharibacteria bacterium]|nr:tRNA-dihydrouridine synthase [Candidatus Saccharibacteria bacterium]